MSTRQVGGSGPCRGFQRSEGLVAAVARVDVEHDDAAHGPRRDAEVPGVVREPVLGLGEVAARIMDATRNEAAGRVLGGEWQSAEPQEQTRRPIRSTGRCSGRTGKPNRMKKRAWSRVVRITPSLTGAR